MSRRPLASRACLTRREIVGSAVAAFGMLGCGGAASKPRSSPVSRPNDAPLRLDPLTNLVPAAGLVCLSQVKIKALEADAALAGAAAGLMSATFLERISRRYGFDLLHIDELVLGGYAEALLTLVRGSIEPGRIERAFALRADLVEGRALEGGVTRLWGTVDANREQVAVFGRGGVGFERGRLGPLRAAVYFAEAKLKRALPALQGHPLAALDRCLGEAPIRLFAPGPFEGDWAAGLGGVLASATGVACSLSGADSGARQTSSDDAPVLRLVVAGGWGERADDVAKRVALAFAALARDPLGLLMGLDHPLRIPTTKTVLGDAPDPTGAKDALVMLEVAVDPVALVRGLRAATSASLAEILSL